MYVALCAVRPNNFIFRITIILRIGAKIVSTILIGISITKNYLTIQFIYVHYAHSCSDALTQTHTTIQLRYSFSFRRDK